MTKIFEPTFFEESLTDFQTLGPPKIRPKIFVPKNFLNFNQTHFWRIIQFGFRGIQFFRRGIIFPGRSANISHFDQQNIGGG